MRAAALGCLLAAALSGAIRIASEPDPLVALRARADAVSARGWADLRSSTRAILPPRGARLASLEVEPGHDGFVLYFGFDPALAQTFQGEIAIEVTRRGARAAAPLYSRSFQIGADPGEALGWHELSIDLSDHPGLKGIELAKSSRGTFVGPVPGLEPTDLVYWSGPHYWSRREPGDVNVILISLDTLRADHMGVYGYTRRPTTPNLDAWARDAVVFEQAIAQAPWTTPSHYAILSSTYPSHNGSDLPYQERERVVPDRVPFLSHLLRDAGYHTAAFTGQGSMSARNGFHRGFSIFEEHGFTADSDVEAVCASALGWLERHGDHRFFLFLHTYEPHQPFSSTHFVDAEKIPSSDRRAEQIARYDGDIRRTDAVIGRLLGRLREMGLEDQTWIVLTSDHGEDLGGRFLNDAEPYIEHGHSLFDELLHVPLLVKPPRGQRVARRIAWQVRSVDIAPTVLDLLGLEAPPHFAGVSLRKAIEAGDPLQLEAFSEATTRGAALRSLRTERVKFIRRVGPGQIASPPFLPDPPEDQLYDLERDPGERRNLAAGSPREVARYRARLEALAPGPPVPAGSETDAAELDPQLRESLAALGYLD
jgi:arylsulfatase A-like enzyme